MSTKESVARECQMMVVVWTQVDRYTGESNGVQREAAGARERVERSSERAKSKDRLVEQTL